MDERAAGPVAQPPHEMPTSRLPHPPAGEQPARGLPLAPPTSVDSEGTEGAVESGYGERAASLLETTAEQQQKQQKQQQQMCDSSSSGRGEDEAEAGTAPMDMAVQAYARKERAWQVAGLRFLAGVPTLTQPICEFTGRINDQTFAKEASWMANDAYVATVRARARVRGRARARVRVRARVKVRLRVRAMVRGR